MTREEMEAIVEDAFDVFDEALDEDVADAQVVELVNMFVQRVRAGFELD